MLLSSNKAETSPLIVLRLAADVVSLRTHYVQSALGQNLEQLEV